MVNFSGLVFVFGKGMRPMTILDEKRQN